MVAAGVADGWGICPAAHGGQSINQPSAAKTIFGSFIASRTFCSRYSSLLASRSQRSRAVRLRTTPSGTIIALGPWSRPSPRGRYILQEHILNAVLSLAGSVLVEPHGLRHYLRSHFLDTTFKGLYHVNAFDLALLVPYFIVLVLLAAYGM